VVTVEMVAMVTTPAVEMAQKVAKAVTARLAGPVGQPQVAMLPVAKGLTVQHQATQV
jgi:hypothetical protein